MTLDVFYRHSGIVNEDADRQSQPAECHDVDRLSDSAENDDGGQKGHRNGDRDDERAAPAPEENQDHGGSQHGGKEDFLDDAVDGAFDEDRLTTERFDFELRRECVGG